MADTSEYATPRDGQRRQGRERRSGVRMWRTATVAFKYATGIAAIIYCFNGIGKLGSSAFHLAVAAQQLNASVATLGPRLDQLSRREDSLLADEGLLASHLAKLDTITLQQQRAIQALGIRVDNGRRGGP